MHWLRNTAYSRRHDDSEDEEDDSEDEEVDDEEV